MTDKKPDKSFAEKYGLVGKGIPIRISERTELLVKLLHAKGKAIFEAGKAAAKLDKTLYK